MDAEFDYESEKQKDKQNQKGINTLNDKYFDNVILINGFFQALYSKNPIMLTQNIEVYVIPTEKTGYNVKEYNKDNVDSKYALAIFNLYENFKDYEDSLLKQMQELNPKKLSHEFGDKVLLEELLNKYSETSNHNIELLAKEYAYDLKEFLNKKPKEYLLILPYLSKSEKNESEVSNESDLFHNFYNSFLKYFSKYWNENKDKFYRLPKVYMIYPIDDKVSYNLSK